MDTQMKRYSRANCIPETHWKDTKSLERYCIFGAQKSSRHRVFKIVGENKLQTYTAFQENASIFENTTVKLSLREFMRQPVNIQTSQPVGLN
jgi:precorrin-6x reductase